MLLLTSGNVQVAAIESLRMPPPAVAQMLVETKIQKAVLAEATRKAAARRHLSSAGSGKTKAPSMAVTASERCPGGDKALHGRRKPTPATATLAKLMAQTTRLPQGASAQGTKQLVQSEALGSGLLASLLWAIASDLAAAAGIRGATPGAGRSSRGTGTMIGATHQQ